MIHLRIHEKSDIVSIYRKDIFADPQAITFWIKKSYTIAYFILDFSQAAC